MYIYTYIHEYMHTHRPMFTLKISFIAHTQQNCQGIEDWGNAYLVEANQETY